MCLKEGKIKVRKRKYVIWWSETDVDTRCDKLSFEKDRRRNIT